MRPALGNARARTLLLVVSLAFNLGLCLAMVMRSPSSTPQPKRSWGDGKWRHRRMPHELDLSVEQEEKLAALRRELFERLRAAQRRLRDESDALAELLTAPELDMQAVSAQVEKVAAVRGEIQWQMIQHILGIREILEPRQLAQLKDFVGRVLRGPGWRGRPGRGPGPAECPPDSQPVSGPAGRRHGRWP